MITKDCDSKVLVLYEFDDQQWRDVTRFPEEIGSSLPSIYIHDDNLTIFGKDNQIYYTYSFPKNEWIQVDSYEKKRALWNQITTPYTSKEIFGRGYLLEYNQNKNINSITSPENKQFDLSLGRFCGSWGMTDEEDYFYIQTYTYPDKQSDKIVSHLWSDRNGEWEKISTGDRCLGNIAFSDDSARTIWCFEGSYLAFLRDGQWSKVLLPSGTVGYVLSDRIQP